MRKTTVVLAAAVFVMFGVSVTPASAQVVKDSSCTNASGVTWDCHYHMKDVTVGAPITFQVNYSCPGPCGPVMSFGLGEKGFFPASEVSGHLVRGSRLPSAMSLTFVFDALSDTGNHSKGTANFVMNLMVDDGAGGMVAMPCPVDVRLKTDKE